MIRIVRIPRRYAVKGNILDEQDFCNLDLDCHLRIVESAFGQMGDRQSGPEI